MTTFDKPSANLKILKHLTNVDLWTASLPEDATSQQIEQARIAAEDYAEMIFESLNVTVTGVTESGSIIAELTPLDDDALENFIVDFSAKFVVSEDLD